MSEKEEIKVEPKEGHGESSDKRMFSTQDMSDIQKKLEEAAMKSAEEEDGKAPQITEMLAETQEDMEKESGSDSPEKEQSLSEAEESNTQDENSSEPAEDFENKIEKAMEKIVSDTTGEPPQPKPAPTNVPRPDAAHRAMRAGSPAAQAAEKKSGKALKIAGIAAAMVVVAAGSAYGVGTYYFSNKFLPGTSVNGIDCSAKTAAQVEKMIAQKVEGYSIEVKARDQRTQTIEGSSIDYQYAPDGSIEKLLDKQKPYQWVTGFFRSTAFTAEENISFDKQKLKEQLLSLDCAKEENQTAPSNAYVAFQDNQFVIVPETEGSALDDRKAYQALKDAVADSDNEVDFSTQNVYETAQITEDDPALAATLQECNNYTKASITYTFGSQTEVLDANTIKDWLQFDESGQFVKDDEAFKQRITEYVAGLAQRHDTLGTDRTFTATSGRTVTVGGGEYGWQINQSEEVNQLFNEITSGQTVSREPIYSSTASSYEPDDIGSTYIEVDLSAQHMYFYRDGALIFDSEFVSGNMSYSDRATPTGIYSLYYKKSPDVLRGRKLPDGSYEYESPVTYWMPFCGGVGFHDANWRSSFGGDIYLTNGSHGCINLPPAKAGELYNIIEGGIPIVMFY